MPVAEILDRVRAVVASAEPFDPDRSKRRFVVGAVDGIGSVVLPGLVAAVGRAAPGITIGVRSIFPNEVIETLDRRAVDLALAPVLRVPARFAARELYTEDFVIGARVGHPLLAQPTLEDYCAASHLLVAQAADSHGFVDDVLAARGLSRRVALTVPSFMWALAVLAETDLVGAMPRRLVARHGPRAGVAAAEPPVPLRSDPIAAVTVKAAMADAGVAWLVDRAAEAVGHEPR